MSGPSDEVESPAPSARRRLRGQGRATADVAARLLGAIVGGYALANLAAIAVGLVLPIARVDAVSTGFLLGFAVHAGAVVWCFAAASAGRTWLGLGVAAAPCLVVIGAARLAGGG